MRHTIKRKLRSGLALFFTLIVGVPALATLPAGERALKIAPHAAYVPNEVLVKFKPQLSIHAMESAVTQLGYRPAETVMEQSWLRVSLASDQTVEGAIAAFASDSAVAQVQPNYIYRALALPNDARFGEQWGLKNTGKIIVNGSYSANNPPPASGSDMNLESAWDLVSDCRSVIVAVIDSGVNYTHEDLAANMWDGGTAYPNHGWDYVSGTAGDNDPIPSDGNGHGTHVAATIAAAGNNNVGTAGVCWRARIMAIRSLSESGGTTASIIQGIDFAVARGARVLNMSLGGAAFDSAFSDAITRARTAGVLVVVAAGNDGTNNDGSDPMYPCNFTHDNIVCVAALDQAYGRASFSNYGAISVDVGAPGTNILSAWPGATTEDNFASGWTATGAWTAVPCTFGTTAYPMWVNPATWCGSAAATYANNANDIVYKTFDLSSVLGAGITFLGFVDTEAGADFFSVGHRSAGGDPFVGGTIMRYSGSTRGFALPFAVDLSDCLTVTCSFGMRLTSNASVVDGGLGVLLFSINTTQTGSAEYHLADGTSMAAPHVAGIAALLFSYNPGFNYLDVANAIKNGGDQVSALAGRTTTGRAADAMGALRYINSPSGVTAVVQ